MIELTAPLQKALDESKDPVEVLDPRTRTRYVLLKAEFYERVKDLFSDGPLSPEEKQAIVAGVWKRAGWDDPAMDEYAKLLPQTRK
ncbi:MAG: hypothetical protein HY040_28200 [Planctomycetes bacterium]|nr:hypothetical protein [Planctomycetota bacterium]